VGGALTGRIPPSLRFMSTGEIPHASLTEVAASAAAGDGSVRVVFLAQSSLRLASKHCHSDGIGPDCLRPCLPRNDLVSHRPTADMSASFRFASFRPVIKRSCAIVMLIPCPVRPCRFLSGRVWGPCPSPSQPSLPAGGRTTLPRARPLRSWW
jgi:hypothetical protein